MAYQGIFRRKEIKYLLDRQKYNEIFRVIGEHMQCDEYGKSLICSLYFDTPDFRLIRDSIQKPTTYKEKLRLRSYGTPCDESIAFAELKKKYKGIVYKRRVKLPYLRALEWLSSDEKAPEDGQIWREIDYFKTFYKDLYPAIAITYERMAYYSERDEGLRVTFDRNIRYRFENTDLRLGADGEELLGEGMYLMEIKIPDAMPLWLSAALSECGIYPASYSKYGNAYTRKLLQNIDERVLQNERTNG